MAKNEAIQKLQLTGAAMLVLRSSTFFQRPRQMNLVVSLTVELNSPSFQSQTDGNNLRFVAATSAAKRRPGFLQEMTRTSLQSFTRLWTSVYSYTLSAGCAWLPSSA